MNILIEDDKFTTSLCDNRNNFGFNKVITLPNMISNFPNKTSYSVYYNQISRLFNANNKNVRFTNDVNKLK